MSCLAIRAWSYVGILATLLLAAGCDSSPPTSGSSESPKSNQSRPPSVETTDQAKGTAGAQSPPANVSSLIESQLLRGDMIEATVELLQKQQPGVDIGQLRTQAESTLEAEIGGIRQDYPQFLMLAPETEARLRNGQPADDLKERILRARARIGEATLPMLADDLLGKFESGELTAVRSEVLAQLMTGVALKIDNAISSPGP